MRALTGAVLTENRELVHSFGLAALSNTAAWTPHGRDAVELTLGPTLTFECNQSISAKGKPISESWRNITTGF
jgi:hypothetical protein